MNPRGRGSALLLVVLLATAAGADDTQERPGRYRLGPIWITPRLDLKNAGVNTNVYNTLTGEVPDNAIVFGPAATGAWPVSDRLRLTGSGFVYFNYFHQQETESSTDFGGDGRAELKGGPFLFYGGGGGSETSQRYTIDVTERIRQQAKFGFTGATLRVGTRVRLTGEGRGQIVNVEGRLIGGHDIREDLDRNTLTASGQLRYDLTRKTNLLFSADAIEDRFLHASPGDLRPRQIRSYRFLGGFEFAPRALIRGKVLVGWREVPQATGVSSYRGPALSVDASMPVTRFAVLSGLFSRDVQYAVGRFESVDAQVRSSYVSGIYQGQLALSVPLSLLLRTSLGFEEAKYLAPVIDQGRAIDRLDHLYTASATLLRRITSSMALGGTVTWTRRVSNVQSVSYEGWQYGFSGEITP